MCYNRCMKNGTRLKNWIGRIDWLLIGTLCVLIMGYVMLHDLCGGTLFRHNDWDSYTLQALAWREGRTALSQNYSWLELAVYNGQYYVSFPPLPSVVMLPLTYIWGADTPNNVVVMVWYAPTNASVNGRGLVFGAGAESGAVFWCGVGHAVQEKDAVLGVDCAGSGLPPVFAVPFGGGVCVFLHAGQAGGGHCLAQSGAAPGKIFAPSPCHRAMLCLV